VGKKVRLAREVFKSRPNVWGEVKEVKLGLLTIGGEVLMMRGI